MDELFGDLVYPIKKLWRDYKGYIRGAAFLYCCTGLLALAVYWPQPLPVAIPIAVLLTWLLWRNR